MKKIFHKYFHLIVLAVSLVFMYTSEGFSQAPIRITGGNVTMTITTGTAGGQLVNVVNTACRLRYRRQTRTAKITVATSCPGQRFNLSVVATAVTKGVAQPAVTLSNGNPAVDFIRDIPRTGALNGNCTLQYTASATFAQGNSTELGNDVHTVTYTIQAQ